MGSHFVKTGLGNDANSATYYDTPQQAVAAFGQQSKAPEQMSNTYTPGLQFSQGGALAQDPETPPVPSFLQTQNPVTPKYQTPSFLQAQNSPQLAQKSETKMGKLFQILNSVASGGAAGYGAPTVGQGFAAAQSADLQRKQQFATQQQQQIENQRNANNDATRSALSTSEIAANNARAKKDSEEKDVYTAGGAIFQKQPDGSFKEVATSHQSPEETEAGRATIIQGLKSTKNYSLTPQQEQTYLLTGRLPSQAEHNVSEWQSELDAADGDPSRALSNSEARRKRISAAGRSDSENNKAGKERLSTDVTNYYGHVVASGGTTDEAIKQVTGRINSGQLTPYQQQVASETLRRLRSEQQSALR